MNFKVKRLSDTRKPPPPIHKTQQEPIKKPVSDSWTALLCEVEGCVGQKQHWSSLKTQAKELNEFSHTTYSAVFSGLVILFLNLIIKLPNWPQISSNSALQLPWAGSNGDVKNRQPANVQMQRFLERPNIRHKGAAGGGSSWQGLPLCLSGRQVHTRIGLAYQSCRFQERMVPVLPLPQSQIPICPHGLTSKSFGPHTTANSPNCITGCKKNKPNHRILTSQHFRQVVLLLPKTRPLS